MEDFNKIEFEPIESPEYIAKCEENNWGYRYGVSTDGMWTKRKVWCSDDKTNKEHRFFITSTFDPFSESRLVIKPYRISSQDGTYKSELQIRDEFLNGLEWGIAMPTGKKFDIRKLPKFNVKYNNDENS